MNLAFFPCCISSAFLEQYETATKVVMAELGIESGAAGISIAADTR